MEDIVQYINPIISYTISHFELTVESQLDENPNKKYINLLFDTRSTSNEIFILLS